VDPSNPVNDADTVFGDLRAELAIPTPPKPPKLRGRLVVVESVYHQRTGEQPIQVRPSRFERDLTDPEQPYVREFRADSEWKSLDNGWIEESGQLVLHNLEGSGLTAIPTPEERQAILDRVVELGVAIPTEDDGRRTQWSAPRPPWPVATFAWIRPGESCRFEPYQVSMIRVRCRPGAKCLLTLLPE
jgi:hypothetical protein